jgi:3-deoxy-D-arabino-heptulosonate 7-phosphate (DAHP) synthase class II
MESVQTRILKEFFESQIGMIPINDSLSNEELSALNKLETFGVLKKENRSFRPAVRFHKYGAKLIELDIPVEQFDFDDQVKPNQTFNNTIHAQTIGQINQGSGNYSFEQINIEIVKQSLEAALTPEQLIEVMEALKQNGKQGALQKLKSFGGDVLANVIASIISNPLLYGGM